MTERMYGELAAWWPLLSPVAEYEEEAALFREILLAHTPRPRTLLELGSGGGHNAFYLKAHFEGVTLVDRAPEMLAQSRRLNMELTHVVGDMRHVRLGRTFDAVFIHDAITYMTTRADLGRALATAAAHLREGGLLLVVPDETAERFAPGTECGGTDDGARGIRYLEWVHDPDPDDELVTTDYVYAIREEDGATRVLHERHLSGLFPRRVWLEQLEAAGFQATSQIASHSALEEGYELFLGVRR